MQCVGDIGKAIDSYFGGFHYHIGFEKGLIEIYDMKQIRYVVTYSIQQKLSDGRIDKENKTWALQSQVNQGEGDPRPEHTVYTHSGLLNLFVDSTREQQLVHKAKENMKGSDAGEIKETDLGIQM